MSVAGECVYVGNEACRVRLTDPEIGQFTVTAATEQDVARLDIYAMGATCGVALGCLSAYVRARVCVCD